MSKKIEVTKIFVFLISKMVSFFLAIGWTFRAEPFAFRFGRETDARKMKPLDRALV